MAAYASVTSLMHLMDQVEQHQNLRRQIFFHNQQIESLRHRVVFFQEFLEGFSHSANDEEAEVLERAIATAAQAAEDVIESHIVEQLGAKSTGQGSASFVALRDLCEIIADMYSVKEMVTDVQEKATTQIHSIPIVNTLRPPPTGKSAMVGFDEKIIEIKDRLTGDQRAHQVIPIIGMGGIGKTTLAKVVYEDPLVVECFHLRIWVTVSQGYSVKELLLQALNEKGDSGVLESDDQLGERLYKHLFGRKYLLILDDIWRIEDWEKIRRFFPDNNNKSRIVITSRLSSLGSSFSSFALKMEFLDEHNSWYLFCEKAFGSLSCPPEFEKIGKEIVQKCKGLPLSIIVIGGLLGRSPRTQEYWKNIAKDMNSILSLENDKQCLSILSLSYTHLPVHLKPCFLYMGLFQEDTVIHVSKVKKLWVAEGFLKPNNDKSLEEAAIDYLKDLIDRNLILVDEILGLTGNIRYCSIHDLLREVCLSIAQKEKFFCRTSMFNPDTLPDVKSERRIVINTNPLHDNEGINQTLLDVLKSKPLVRSLFCNSNECGLQEVVNFELLRIFYQDLEFSRFWRIDDESFHGRINMRYLNFSYAIADVNFKAMIPSIYHLWNLQTITFVEFSGQIVHALPSIWGMHQLRHIHISMLKLPDPPMDQACEFVLGNLQTLKVVLDFKWTDQVLQRIPNIKKLEIEYVDYQVHSLDYCLNNIGRFRKLESLRCSFRNTPSDSESVTNLTFPTSLKRLELIGCAFHWENMMVIGSLPLLEVLMLGKDSVVGHEWKLVEGAFQSLKYLEICNCSTLTYWDVDSSECFPVLETLKLDNLDNLSEVPSGIAEISTLKLIEVISCSESTVTSAVNILEEQFCMGNEDLHVEIMFRSEEERRGFGEQIDFENLESYRRKNLRFF